MTAQLKITRDDLESLAFHNPHATIAFEPDRAVLELDGVEYIADLTMPGQVA